MHIRIRLRFDVILTAVAACLFASCGGTTATPPSDGREITEPFLKQVREGQLDDAWTSTTAEFKSFLGKEEFRRFVTEHAVLKEPLEFTGHELVKTYGLTRNQCGYKPTAANATAKIRVLLAQEQDKWKVEAIFVE